MRRTNRYTAVTAAQEIAETDDESVDSESSEEEDAIEEDQGSPSESSSDEDMRATTGNLLHSEQYKSCDGFQWSEIPIRAPQGRPPACNVLHSGAGPTREVAVRALTPCESFTCFLTEEIIGIIVRCTNEEGNRVFRAQWKNTSRDEILTYLGLLILAGVYRGRMEPVIHLWSNESGRPVFGKAMGRVRFQTITRCLRFDSKDTRPERRSRDKLAPIRELHDKFAARCRANFKPGPNVCVDEQLVVFRGRCPFRVYLPNKPGKYGIKVWVCCDVDTAYCSNFEVYTGKTGRAPEVGQGERVVLQMTAHLSGSGRGCTGDNFFTSSKLSLSLLQRNMTYVGTVRKNKSFLPPVIRNPRSQQFSSRFAYSEKMTLVSYTPRKGRNAILLSSQHLGRGEVDSENQKQKPEIISHYNQTKGAVDTLDKLVRIYSCQRKSNRWPLILFQTFVDIAVYNAFVVFLNNFPDFENGKTQRRRLFLERLGMDLCTPAIQSRQPLPLQPLTVQSRGVTSGPRKRSRCGRCPRDTDKKTSETCYKCHLPVCKSHSVMVCNYQCSE